MAKFTVTTTTHFHGDVDIRDIEVEANHAAVENAHLVFNDEKGVLVAAFAPGHFLRVIPVPE